VQTGRAWAALKLGGGLDDFCGMKDFWGTPRRRWAKPSGAGEAALDERRPDRHAAPGLPGHRYHQRPCGSAARPRGFEQDSFKHT